MTVEELRDRLNGLIGDVVRQLNEDAYGDFDGTIPPVINELIAAAKEEGAEQERERIRKGSQMVGVEKDGVNFIGGVDYVGSAFLVPVDVMDPPTLSPAPKEPNYYAVGDNGESGESHSATSSGDHWELKLVHGPETAGLG